MLHTTEGAQEIESLANWFRESRRRKSHRTSAPITGAIGTIAEYVRRDRAAWAQGNYNSASTCIEMCTPSGAANGWSRSHWLNTQGWLLDNCAAWIAEEARHYGIPIVKLSAAQAQGSGRGSVRARRHINRGDRTDPGAGVPVGLRDQQGDRRCHATGTAPTPIRRATT